MNNFPAMTAEKRQELITECENEIAELTKSIQRCDAIGTADYLKHLQNQLLRQQIALASLEAPPIHQVQLDDAWVDLSEGAMKSQLRHGATARTVYTVPPAPVLRLPDEAETGSQCAAMGWNACLAEVKRLNNQPEPPAPVLRVPVGWKLVPMVPTEAMIMAAQDSEDVLFDKDDDSLFIVDHKEIYRAMLENAPEAGNEQ